MKQYYFSILLILITSLTYSQNKKVKNIFKINIAPFFSNVYEYQYERQISKNSSFQIGFGRRSKETNDRDEFQDIHLEIFRRTLNNPKDTNYSEKIFLINFDYRYYFSENETLSGFYISPSIQYLNYKERLFAREMASTGNRDGTFSFFDQLDEREFKLYNLRVNFGYQLIFLNHIIINPYLGVGLAFGEAKDFLDREDTDAKGFSINGGLYIGLGF